MKAHGGGHDQGEEIDLCLGKVEGRGGCLLFGGGSWGSSRASFHLHFDRGRSSRHLGRLGGRGREFSQDLQSLFLHRVVCRKVVAQGLREHRGREGATEGGVVAEHAVDEAELGGLDRAFEEGDVFLQICICVCAYVCMKKRVS